MADKPKRLPATPPKAGKKIGSSPNTRNRVERFDDLTYAEPLMSEEDAAQGYTKLPAGKLTDKRKDDYA
jgi:hypothetical protein